MRDPSAHTHALVIQQYLDSQAWSVLTATSGITRMYLTTGRAHSNVTRGYLIAYEPSPHTPHRARLADVLAQPAPWAQHDLLFVHHTLELIQFFVPAGQESHKVFSWCLQLYSNDQITANDTPHARILFLLYLMYSIGMYPDCSDTLLVHSWGARQNHPEHVSNGLEQLLHHGLPFDFHQSIQWLLTCIAEHPRAHTFKTISYLKGR